MPDCPFNQCLIYEAEKCGSKILGTPHIFIEVAAPWNVYVYKNVVEGYSFEVCLRCSNDYLNYDYDNWLIEQIKMPVVEIIDINPYPEFSETIENQLFEVSEQENSF